MAGLGDDLRAAREARNLTLSDISERIHIRTVYLQSLEEEDWESIAAPVYVRGFLRTYARFLGLDPEASVARFNASLPATGGTAPAPAGRRLEAPRRRGPSPWLWIVGAIAVALVIYVGYNYYELQQDQQAVGSADRRTPPTASAPPDAASPQAAPRTTAAAPRATPFGGANGLGVRLVARSWVRVEIDGTVAMEGVYPPGTQRVFHGKEATVRVGNAAGVDLTVNGRAIGALGTPGTVAERSFKLAQE